MPIPGELFLHDDAIMLNPGRPTISLTVENTGDRAVQIGSHYHFFEVNRALAFDRAQAMGMRLAIPAGTSVRFEPGQMRDVTLVTIGGTRRAVGFSGLTNGSTTARDSVLLAHERAARLGFAGATPPDPSAPAAPAAPTEPTPPEGDRR